MDHDSADLLRAFGASTRVWAATGQHHVDQEWWLALSGESNVNLNLACCRSARNAVFTEHCLQPIIDLGEPGIIMLAGPGLSHAQTLVDAGWVGIGTTPLMFLAPLPQGRPADADVRSISLEELPLCRELLRESFRMNESSAAVVMPDSVVERGDVGVSGIFEGSELAAVVTIVVQDGLAIVWSMATRPERQGQGYGRRLLDAVLSAQARDGATGTLLLSSKAGERLYQSLGYSVVEYLQLWSRPRWVLGFA